MDLCCTSGDLPDRLFHYCLPSLSELSSQQTCVTEPGEAIHSVSWRLHLCFQITNDNYMQRALPKDNSISSNFVRGVVVTDVSIRPVTPPFVLDSGVQA